MISWGLEAEINSLSERVTVKFDRRIGVIMLKACYRMPWTAIIHPPAYAITTPEMT